MATIPRASDLTQKALQWFHAGASQFHVVEQATRLLDAAGFHRLHERSNEKFPIQPGQKYYLTRNQSALIAFAVGKQWRPGNGFIAFAAHTDSPVVKVKPVSRVERASTLVVNVEVYGGGRWDTWFDRDLAVAGRVIVRTANGKLEARLVRINRPILRIPNLAIHLYPEVRTEGFKPNTHHHLQPILATSIKQTLLAKELNLPEESKRADTDNVVPASEDHHPLLLTLLAAELGVEVNQIDDFELSLYDTQPAAVGGALNEFIFARGLDNQCMSFVSVQSLIDSSTNESLANEKLIRMALLFDNEEIGSRSIQGADSNLMMSLLARINGYDTLDAAIHRSLLVSADMAHALHPNYIDKHEPKHTPLLGKGLVVKHNANQRYATSSLTALPLREAARRHNLPLQKFSIRNDMGCGSTVGPILAGGTGMRTVDVGIAQWSMHSIRETCSVDDIQSTYELFKALYCEFAEIDAATVVLGEQ